MSTFDSLLPFACSINDVVMIAIAAAIAWQCLLLLLTKDILSSSLPL